MNGVQGTPKAVNLYPFLRQGRRAMKRYELTDDDGAALEKLLRGNRGHAGGQAEDNRLFVMP